MKKFILSALSLMMALTMSAITYQTQVSITLDDGTYLPALVVGESSDLAAGVNNGYAGEIQNLDEMPLAIYAIYGGVKYSTFSTKSYTNLPVGIKTTEATTYHLYFDDVTGSVNLYDKKTGAPVPVTEDGDYEFTISNEEKNSLLNDRFVINYNPAAFVTSVTTNADGWASFAYTADVAPAYPAGLTAYKGALNTTDPDNMVVDLTAVSAIPAGAGVFVHGAANTTYYFSAAASAPALTGNQIVGCTDATDPASITDAAIYTLRNVGGTTALYQYVGTAAIPAGKAYLPIAISAGAPARIAIRVAQPTDVREVEATVKAEKFMEDGKIYIRRGDNIYNLQGQKVN